MTFSKRVVINIPSLLMVLLITLELWLFFVIHVYGISITAARLLSVILLPAFFIYVFQKTNINKLELNVYKWWVIFYSYVLVTGAIGILLRSYTDYSLSKYVVKDIVLLFLQIAFYIFVFVHIISSERRVEFVLSGVRNIGFVAVIIGVIDLFVNFFIGIDLIPRHISDGVDVGSRFHGLFGEPRDAAVVVGFLLFIEFVYIKFFMNGKSVANYRVLLYLLMMFLSQSLSSIIGLILGLGLYFIVFIWSMNRWKSELIIGAMAILFICVFFIFNSPRLIIYYENTFELIMNISHLDKENVPPVFSGQLPNLYSVTVFFNRWAEGEYFSFLFGSGIGSSVYVNHLSGFWPEEVIYPPSNIMRWILDYGLFGSLGFLSLLLLPVVRYFKREDISNYVIAITLSYTCSISLAIFHRSPILFIIVGVLWSIINVFPNSELRKKVL